MELNRQLLQGISAQVGERKDWLKVVIISRFNEWQLSSNWSGAERQRDGLRPEVSSPRTAGPCGEQLSADLVEIGQGEHGLRAGQVLGQTAVAHFGEAPQLLDDAKGVFAG